MRYVIDSAVRDRTLYPTPSRYRVHVADPAKDISAIRLADYHMPASPHIYPGRNEIDIIRAGNTTTYVFADVASGAPPSSAVASVSAAMGVDGFTVDMDASRRLRIAHVDAFVVVDGSALGALSVPPGSRSTVDAVTGSQTVTGDTRLTTDPSVAFVKVGVGRGGGDGGKSTKSNSVHLEGMVDMIRPTQSVAAFVDRPWFVLPERARVFDTLDVSLTDRFGNGYGTDDHILVFELVDDPVRRV